MARKAKQSEKMANDPNNGRPRSHRGAQKKPKQESVNRRKKRDK